MVDLELHSNYVPGAEETIFDVNRRVSTKTCVMPILPNDRFLCSFQHIFAGEMFVITFLVTMQLQLLMGLDLPLHLSWTGGYSAGYYSYKV